MYHKNSNNERVILLCSEILAATTWNETSYNSSGPRAVSSTHGVCTYKRVFLRTASAFVCVYANTCIYSASWKRVTGSRLWSHTWQEPRSPLRPPVLIGLSCIGTQPVPSAPPHHAHSIFKRHAYEETACSSTTEHGWSVGNYWSKLSLKPTKRKNHPVCRLI